MLDLMEQLNRKINKERYITKGCYKILEKGNVEITELPIGEWTDNYKEHQKRLCLTLVLKRIKNRYYLLIKI